MLDFLHTVKGPDFLFLFILWFLILRVTVGILRNRGYDNPLTTFLGVGLFEALAIARIVVGSAHGMHKWDFLLTMMVIGGFLFFIRLDQINYTGTGGSGSSCSSSSSSSSCSGGGGGCGGGGGYGGCGGS